MMQRGARAFRGSSPFLFCWGGGLRAKPSRRSCIDMRIGILPSVETRHDHVVGWLRRRLGVRAGVPGVAGTGVGGAVGGGQLKMTTAVWISYALRQGTKFLMHPTTMRAMTRVSDPATSNALKTSLLMRLLKSSAQTTLGTKEQVPLQGQRRIFTHAVKGSHENPEFHPAGQCHVVAPVSQSSPYRRPGPISAGAGPCGETTIAGMILT